MYFISLYSNKVYNISMGRTIPSFRIASIMEEIEWKPFRKRLDKSDRENEAFIQP
jgi:hypothetical protein